MSGFIRANQFNIDNLSFAKPVGQAAGTHRVLISYDNGSGPKPLNLETPKLFSFGVSPQAPMGETVKDDLSNVQQYTLPLCLYDHRNGPTDDENLFINVIEQIVERTKTHCTSTKFNEQVEKYGEEQFTLSDLKKLNPIYQKKEKGIPVPGKSPTLYAKLKCQKNNDKLQVVTSFYDSSEYTNDTSVRIDSTDPMTLIGKRMHVKGGIHVESVFIGSKISLQLKLQQVLYQPVEQKMFRLSPFDDVPANNNLQSHENPVLTNGIELSDDE